MNFTRKSLMVLVVVIIVFLLFNKTENTSSSGRMYPLTLTPTIEGNTPTPIPAPEPTMVFTTGKGIDTNQDYAPTANTICWTWNQYIGHIGTFSIPGGKQLLVIKFLTNQPTMSMNNVVCEVSESRTPEERASWANAREAWYYPWSKIVTYYVGNSLQIVTLTPTYTVTSTPSVTQTYTATPTSSETIVPSETVVPSFTSTLTWTKTKSPTPTRTLTSSRTGTPTFTKTRAATRTWTATLTPTPSKTPILKPDWEVAELVTTIIKPEKGDICWGKVVDKYFNVTVEFTKNYNSGIQLRGGGCFKSKYYPFSEVFFYLFKKGIKYDAIQLPEERKVTPTITLSPTITVIPRLPEEWKTVSRSKFRAFTGTICWGDKVADFEYKVVNFTKDSRSDFWIVNGACYAGEKYSPEDIYNYLKRNGKPINGIVNTP